MFLGSKSLSMPINSNFKLNGASGETWKPPDPYFASKKGGMDSGGFSQSSINLEIAINHHT